MQPTGEKIHSSSLTCFIIYNEEKFQTRYKRIIDAVLKNNIQMHLNYQQNNKYTDGYLTDDYLIILHNFVLEKTVKSYKITCYLCNAKNKNGLMIYVEGVQNAGLKNF